MGRDELKTIDVNVEVHKSLSCQDLGLTPPWDWGERRFTLALRG